MLDNIENLARSYIYCKSAYEDGLIGNPFPELEMFVSRMQIKDVFYYIRGLIAGNHYPDFMSKYEIACHVSIHIIATSKYKYKKWFIRRNTIESIQKGFFSFVRDGGNDDEIDELLPVAVSWLKKHASKYNDLLIYKLMADTGRDCIKLLKFDNINNDDYGIRDKDKIKALDECSDLIECYIETFTSRLIELLGPAVELRHTDKIASSILASFIKIIPDEYKKYNFRLMYETIGLIRKYGDSNLLNELTDCLCPNSRILSVPTVF